MSEINLAAMQDAYLKTKASAPYAFLREPLSLERQGYRPDVAGTSQGAFSERVLGERFGAWPEAPELETDEDFKALKALRTSAETTWRGVIGTIEQVRADDDPTLNNDGRLKILGRVIEPKLEELARTAEREIARVQETIGQVDADITKAIRVVEPVDLAAHDAIRRFWKEQASAKEVTVAKTVLGSPVLSDIEGDRIDTQTLQALAGAPHYLSGITPAQQARARDLLARRMAPALVKRRDGLNAGLTVAAQALTALHEHVNRTIDLKKARQLRERAKVHA